MTKKTERWETDNDNMDLTIRLSGDLYTQLKAMASIKGFKTADYVPYILETWLTAAAVGVNYRNRMKGHGDD